MSIATVPQFEVVPPEFGSIRYVEHGWPCDLIRWHTHEEYELHLMVASTGKVFVGDYIGRFQPGQFVLTGPRLPHNWVTEVGSSDPISLRDMVIQFRHESLTRLAEAFPEFKNVTPMLEMARSGVEFVGFDQSKAQALLASVRDTHGIARVLAFLNVLQQLHEWPNKRALSTAKIHSTLTGVVESKINDAVDYVVENFSQEISLERMATMADMSASAFSRHFQKSTGNKFVDFVNQVRIGKACVLLTESNDQISTICYSVGFNNVANFNRHFVKIKGVTPSEFRRVVRANLSPGTAAHIAPEAT
jgi:AraC-like DNA-binding protein